MPAVRWEVGARCTAKSFYLSIATVSAGNLNEVPIGRAGPRYYKDPIQDPIQDPVQDPIKAPCQTGDAVGFAPVVPVAGRLPVPSTNTSREKTPCTFI